MCVCVCVCVCVCKKVRGLGSSELGMQRKRGATLWFSENLVAVYIFLSFFFFSFFFFFFFFYLNFILLFFFCMYWPMSIIPLGFIITYSWTIL